MTLRISWLNWKQNSSKQHRRIRAENSWRSVTKSVLKKRRENWTAPWSLHSVPRPEPDKPRDFDTSNPTFHTKGGDFCFMIEEPITQFSSSLSQIQMVATAQWCPLSTHGSIGIVVHTPSNPWSWACGISDNQPHDVSHHQSWGPYHWWARVVQRWDCNPHLQDIRESPPSWYQRTHSYRFSCVRTVEVWQSYPQSTPSNRSSSKHPTRVSVGGAISSS